MNTYIVFLRGINVGGKNTVSMTDLKSCLEKLGFSQVSTYIASGNVILRSNKHPGEIKTLIERTLPKTFELDREFIKVLVLSRNELRTVVDNKPRYFGEQPDKYYCDAIFLMDTDTSHAMQVFSPKEGVDKIWPGNNVIYSQRLRSLRTKSRLNKIMASPIYQSMTIRTWGTVMNILNRMDINETI